MAVGKKNQNQFLLNDKRANEKWWRRRKGIGGERMDCTFESNILNACLNMRLNFFSKNKASRSQMDS